MEARNDDAALPVLVLGADALGDRVCAELERAGEHVIRVAEDNDVDRALRTAGVANAASIIALSQDDALNLAVALRARVLNPRIRIVLQQFNPVLGQKIEENLADCAVLSSAGCSAATYAAAALDPACFFAQNFPAADGPMVGFVAGTGAELQFAGYRVADAETKFETRILAIDDQTPERDALITADSRIVAFGRITERARARRAPRARQQPSPRRKFSRAELLAQFHQINPILRVYIAGATLFLLLAVVFFHFGLGKSWLTATYDIVEMITNAGFGEPALTERGVLLAAGAMLAMLGGVIVTTTFIGYVSSAFTRAQWTAMQGLRRIRAREHIVMCGAGKLGSVVLELLVAAGKEVVVVESHPDPWLLRRARSREVQLLTGDATRDDALQYCDVDDASAVLTLTNNDSVNLEIALGTRARSAQVPLVVRMNSAVLAETTSQLFGINTFSQVALSAPIFAALAREPGMRGFVRYAGGDHTLRQHAGHEVRAASGRENLLLCYYRDGAVHVGGVFANMRPWDTVLYMNAGF